MIQFVKESEVDGKRDCTTTKGCWDGEVRLDGKIQEQEQQTNEGS